MYANLYIISLSRKIFAYKKQKRRATSHKTNRTCKRPHAHRSATLRTQKCHFAHTKAALCTGKSGSFLAQKRHFCDTHPLSC